METTAAVAEHDASQSGDAYFDMPAKGTSRCLDLIKARGVVEVEQPIDLGQMPAEPARQFRLFDALLGHQADYCHF